jgi:DMSO/TMAO reductase YedYZ molybdopterin-dependent catalytic subunit
MPIPRRSFFLIAAGGLLHASDPEKRGMLVRAAKPEDLEMPPAGFEDYITPIEHFFVRSHVYVPSVDETAWRLRVEGSVAAPLTLSLGDLRKLPPVELIGVVECAGNGRGFYRPTVAGLQWGNGAVGNARWRGVRLADVLKRAGIQPGGAHVLFDGADVRLGTMPDFQRSIPVKKALDPNTLLAYEMNGQELPVKHGFPLRVVAPGWASDSWVKWVTSIRVVENEPDGFWMKSAYRHPGRPVAPGSAVPPEQMAPVTSLRVKSVISAPLNGAQVPSARICPIRGVAWSGDAGPVTSVEVSVDGGRSWNQAALRAEQRTPFGWRQWEYAWTPTREAYYTILARARDAAGNTQPLDQEWNPSGYGWNVVPRVGVDVVRAVSDAAPPTAPARAEEPLADRFASSCLGCHGDDVIRQQRLTRAQWDREINKMTGWGAKVSAEDRETLLDFLSRRYAP